MKIFLKKSTKLQLLSASPEMYRRENEHATGYVTAVFINNTQLKTMSKLFL